MTPAERNSAQQQQIADLRADLERLRGELTRRERDDKARRRQNDRLQRQNDGLQRQNDRLQHRIDHLEQQLAAARRAGHRQAAPFAKDRPQGRGGRPGRRAGAQYGRHGCRPRPARVDETHAAPVPAACPDCGGAVEVTRVASQYQEELPVVRPVVRRFDVEVGHCSQCQRRVQGHHVLQTSDALGAAGVQLGPGVVALVVELHTEMGVPLAKVAHLLRTTFGLQVTPGGLAHVLHRAARAAAPAYTELCEQVRNAPVVTPDETGWRVGGVRHWLWTFVTPDTTVYAICPGRGFNDAATVLGTDYAGVLVRDGWAQPPGGIGMSVWLVTPRSLVAIGLLSAAVIGCAPAGTTALNDAVDIVAVILRRVPMIIAETIVLFSVATAAAADRGTELRLPAPGPVRAAQSAPAAAAEDSVAIIAFSNISAVTEDDWIGMGIAEALTAELGRAGDLSVVGRQAVSGTAGFAAVPTTVIDGPPPTARRRTGPGREPRRSDAPLSARASS